MNGLAGKTMVVTGGSSGIGLSVARRLREEGSRVAIFDINRPDDDMVISWTKVNVTDGQSIRQGIEDCVTKFGTIDGLVTCAALDQTIPFLEVKEEDLRKITEINYFGTFLALQLVAKKMIGLQKGGSFVTISSTAAYGYRPLTPHYAAAKAAIVNLTTSASWALAPYGIRVNNVMPGLVDTPMLDRVMNDRAVMFKTTQKEIREGFEKLVPLGHRLARTSEIASVVAFLLSDEASYVTGAVVNVTGGVSIV